MKIKRKRVYLFIVEGQSDQDAIEPIIGELLDSKKIYFEVVRGDFTTSYEHAQCHNASKEMNHQLNNIISQFLSRNPGISLKDIEKVIIITDTDGTFVDDSYIIYDRTTDKTRYESDGIYTNNVQNIKRRNEIKSKNLTFLHNTQVIKKREISLEVYYFSCNLDHVLHNVRNLQQGLKEEKAFEFADTYEGVEEKFITFLENMILSKEGYQKSWEKIKQGTNSLERSTNFYEFFSNNQDVLGIKAQNEFIIERQIICRWLSAFVVKLFYAEKIHGFRFIFIT